MTPASLIREIESCSPVRLRRVLEWVQAHPESLPRALPVQLARHLGWALNNRERADWWAARIADFEEARRMAADRGDDFNARRWHTEVKATRRDVDHWVARHRAECLNAISLLREWQKKEAA